MAYAILGLACLAADISDWYRAAMLHGTAQALLDLTGLPWERLEARYRQESLSQIAAAVGDEQLRRACAQGIALSFDQAIDLALKREPAVRYSLANRASAEPAARSYIFRSSYQTCSACTRPAARQGPAELHRAAPRSQSVRPEAPEARAGRGGRPGSQWAGGGQAGADMIISQRPVRVHRDLRAEQVASGTLKLEHVKQVPVGGDVAVQSARRGERQVSDAVPGGKVNQLNRMRANLLFDGGRQARRLG
jgi:hypothetical protein